MKNMRMLSLLVGLMTCLYPALAISQGTEKSIGCGMTEDQEGFQDMLLLYLGAWEVTHLSGYAKTGAMVIPFSGDGQTEIITMIQPDENLVATHPEMQAPMVFDISDEKPWQFLEQDAANDIPSPSITSDEIESLANCKMEDLPRLIGRTTAVVNGVQMDFVWRMILTSANQMFAIQHTSSNVNGMSVISRRTVNLRRVGD